MQLSYSYATELQALTAQVNVQPLYQQRLAVLNKPLSAELNIDPKYWQPQEWKKLLFDHSSDWQKHAIAQKYGGHQFGQWNPHLGDGRGHLLTEIRDKNGARHDLHLKGAGPTPFSRHADGRAVLRSSIREFMVSEAMHYLGIPTSRALCLFTSEEAVQRESLERGAMVIRTCPSHLRFGHFEYYFHHQQFDHLDSLFEYCFKHHFSEALNADNPHLELFKTIVESTAGLIAQWQAIGFNHGVMNTDNMSIHGITFDYGPFAFLDDFVPDYVCNHSDHGGRYAFSQQPSIGLWNLNALAQAFTRHVSVEQLTEALSSFEPLLTSSYHRIMSTKMALTTTDDVDSATKQSIADVRSRWFEMLENQKRDYTQSFRLLMHAHSEPRKIIDHFIDATLAKTWVKDYLALTQRLGTNIADLAQINPNVILRNYHLQQAIEAAENDDFSLVEALFEAIQAPFNETELHNRFAIPPPSDGKGIALSCSS